MTKEQINEIALRVAASLPEFIWEEGCHYESGAVSSQVTDFAHALLAELAKVQEPVAYRWRTYHKQGGYTERLCTDKVECEELNSQYMEEGEVVPLFTQPLPQPDLVAEIERLKEQYVSLQLAQASKVAELRQQLSAARSE